MGAALRNQHSCAFLKFLYGLCTFKRLFEHTALSGQQHAEGTERLLRGNAGCDFGKSLRIRDDEGRRLTKGRKQGGQSLRLTEKGKGSAVQKLPHCHLLRQNKATARRGFILRTDKDDCITGGNEIHEQRLLFRLTRKHADGSLNFLYAFSAHGGTKINILDLGPAACNKPSEVSLCLPALGLRERFRLGDDR